MGTLEPYRMFTSRAEYRLILREDNADLRLTEKGWELGLISETHWRAFNEKREAITQEHQRLKDVWIRPNTTASEALEIIIQTPITREYRAIEMLRRPEIKYQQLTAITEIGPGVNDLQVAEQVEIQAKYAGYIDRQTLEIERMQKYEHLKIPAHFNYDKVNGLSNEIRQKLSQQKPETIGVASRIPGMTPAAISLLLIFLKR
jgi:tRNA uridine 5-carboxymethylaminomethyl modification enzyme